MGIYFAREKAVSDYSRGNPETTLELIARAYIRENPQKEYTARPFLSGEIHRNKDYRYVADFAGIFPHAPNGSYVYVWGKYQSAEEGILRFTLIPKGPAKIWMNQLVIYGTDVIAERYDNTPLTINLPVKKGWNHLVLRFTRTKAGFGGEFGTWLGKLDYYFFRGMERQELSGLLIEGFDYTAPLNEALKDISPSYLAPLCQPLKAWTDEEKSQGVFGRIFKGAQTGDLAIARADICAPANASCCFSGTQSGNCTFYIGDEPVRTFTTPGPFSFGHELKKGCNSFLVISECPGEGQNWGFAMEFASDAAIPLEIANPFFSAKAFPWIYAGPFRKTSRKELIVPFDREQLVGCDGEKTWWRLDFPSAWLRLYNENPLYGHWNYPLGVTLYGLVETARLFKKSGLDAGFCIDSYVRSHAAKSVRTLEYAFFDKEHFGGATSVHHLLTSIDSLDDCGSFGALVLELAKDEGNGGLLRDFGVAADYAGDHILRRQDRLPEGCFYRHRMMHHFHNDTLWADDLYMSVPFLGRYAAYKNNPSILDDAAIQFECYRKYLFMEDKNLMAHVYDFNRNMNTGIPWGRGNGWTIFSLTELLMALPQKHPRRKFLEDFFRNHASGCLACQDENGMWHQVLDLTSSYIETSCTAMFISAFCRGIRYGWFDGETISYRTAAEKAWQALETHVIDREGNIYGVSRGSEFAFNPRYYAEHLLPRLNDTHGIGIVLLAGVELLKLRNQT